MNDTHVTVTKRPINRGALMLALRHLREIKASRAAYEAEVDEWYRSGPGRAPKWHTFIEGDDVYRENVGGQGYRFPECPHGMSLWTDYDNICGPCEDSLTPYQEALYRGHRDWLTWTERTDVVIRAHDLGAPPEVITPMREWAMESMSVMTRTTRPVRNLP